MKLTEAEAAALYDQAADEQRIISEIELELQAIKAALKEDDEREPRANLLDTKKSLLFRKEEQENKVKHMMWMARQREPLPIQQHLPGEND